MSRDAPKPLEVLALCVLALAVIAAIYYPAKIIWAHVQVAQKIAMLRAAGEPTSLADFTSEPIAPELDAATYLQRAKSDCDAIQQAFQLAYEALPKAEQEKIDADQPSPEMVSAIRTAFDAHPDVLAQLSEAARCPGYSLQFNDTSDTQLFSKALITRASAMRAPIRVLDYRVQVLLAHGKSSDALSVCLDMFRLARHFD